MTTRKAGVVGIVARDKRGNVPRLEDALKDPDISRQLGAEIEAAIRQAFGSRQAETNKKEK
jgi:hypothetical protein